ncbi:MAG TPA: hypothetical protein VFF44_03585 [Casimicrobiaceae bacterium]|nr:hypothetical protein [Casimicrobiaceae bacterium]
MGGWITLVVVLVVVGVAGLWIYRRRSSPKASAGGPAAHKDQVAQWGVRIASPAKEHACPQVRGLLGKEFPLTKKPTIPVKDCPFPRECQCHYVKLFDRRHEERRSGEERRQMQRFEQGHHDRRGGKDRRGKPVDWV